MIVLYLLCAWNIFCFSLGDKLIINSTAPKKISDEDYYLSYDYDPNYNISNDNNAKSESLIIPNPDTMEPESYAVDILPQIELPDDSLADPDLKDHNCIDNIMYVYYGSNGKSSKSYGTGIIIIGSVLSCAAQLLTLFCVLLNKNYTGRKSSMLVIVLHIFVALFLSNLIFMLGVYSTKNPDNCFLTAILLNILHHQTSIWIFLYSLYIYERFFFSTPITAFFKNMNWCTLVTYLLPPLITLTTYCCDPQSFETKKFCFKSFRRGTLFNFMIPECGLLLLNTFFAIRAMIRIVNLQVSLYQYQSDSLQALNKELENLKERKEKSFSYVNRELSSLEATRVCLRSLCAMHLMFISNWFITLVALEAVDSTELAYLQSITSMLLNWFMFFRRKTLLPLINFAKDESWEQRKLNEDYASSATEVISITSSDNIPLLKSDSATELNEFCGMAEVKDSSNDCNICTITS
ncbi:hypothetical protein HUJ04_003455 [Dendroctonus ponderosae]|uniref:G-protein coupled receptors family 2 profile 2 domain-containing protein n=2 Tax=Dendroctonus ponderosae TaxID=77166 RepID=A0AAR5QBX2_DENPD|nr:hypothetical protein HUJ04_003455 [Dendroctonus ponderosae]